MASAAGEQPVGESRSSPRSLPLGPGPAAAAAGAAAAALRCAVLRAAAAAAPSPYCGQSRQAARRALPCLALAAERGRLCLANSWLLPLAPRGFSARPASIYFSARRNVFVVFLDQDINNNSYQAANAMLVTEPTSSFSPSSPSQGFTNMPRKPLWAHDSASLTSQSIWIFLAPAT